MTNQLSNEFIFSTSTPLALNDGINSLILGQVNVSAPVNDGTGAASIWPTVSNNANEINYNLLQQVSQEQQQQTQQAVSFSADNLSQMQAQSMSQIVLLPTQNIQLLTNSNVGVLVPTNLLLVSNVEFDAVAQQQQQQQMILHQQQQQHQQLVQQEQECEYITLADTATQTVLSGLAETLNNGQTAQLNLISSNGQIVGIIGSDQLMNLPGGENQVLLAACLDSNENGLSQGNNYDINTMLASTISTMMVEKSDQDQAKQWLKDSYIVNRALKALKKTNGSSHHHHNRPHPQVIRRREQ